MLRNGPMERKFYHAAVRGPMGRLRREPRPKDRPIPCGFGRGDRPAGARRRGRPRSRPMSLREVTPAGRRVQRRAGARQRAAYRANGRQVRPTNSPNGSEL